MLGSFLDQMASNRTQSRAGFYIDKWLFLKLNGKIWSPLESDPNGIVKQTNIDLTSNVRVSNLKTERLWWFYIYL